MRQREATRSSVKRELLRIEGRAVEVTLRLNPRARRLIVKVHPSTGEVSVVAPSRRALDHALEFARDQSPWIARQLARVPKLVALTPGARVPLRGVERPILMGERGNGPVWEAEDGSIRIGGHAEHAPRRLLDYLRREARRALTVRTQEFASRLGAKPGRISVRDMASRWGSCAVNGSLSYSWRLILAPAFVLDYVVAHEVAHLREMNHGPRFWHLVRALVPDIAAPQAWLRANGVALHRYATRQRR